MFNSRDPLLSTCDLCGAKACEIDDTMNTMECPDTLRDIDVCSHCQPEFISYIMDVRAANDRQQADDANYDTL